MCAYELDWSWLREKQWLIIFTICLTNSRTTLGQFWAGRTTDVIILVFFIAIKKSRMFSQQYPN